MNSCIKINRIELFDITIVLQMIHLRWANVTVYFAAILWVLIISILIFEISDSWSDSKKSMRFSWILYLFCHTYFTKNTRKIEVVNAIVHYERTLMIRSHWVSCVCESDVEKNWVMLVYMQLFTSSHVKHPLKISCSLLKSLCQQALTGNDILHNRHHTFLVPLFPWSI